MQQQLILLADKVFLADLRTALSVPGLGKSIDSVSTLAELQDALGAAAAPPRLLCVCTGVIVPTQLLDRCARPAYNIHPGPPEYRGLFPSVFALYDNAITFGVTCHEMAEDVDSGPIIAVRRFPITPTMNRESLDIATYNQVLELVKELATALMDTTQPLAHGAETWSGPVRTKADFEALCELPVAVSETEFQRRYRAVGEGPHHALTTTLFGHRFRLDNRRDAKTVKAGRPL